jgi:hypothetical protein
VQTASAQANEFLTGAAFDNGDVDARQREFGR